MVVLYVYPSEAIFPRGVGEWIVSTDQRGTDSPMLFTYPCANNMLARYIGYLKNNITELVYVYHVQFKDLL